MSYLTKVADFIIYLKNDVPLKMIVILEITSGTAMIGGALLEGCFKKYYVHILTFAAGALLVNLFSFFHNIKETTTTTVETYNGIRLKYWEYSVMIFEFVMLSVMPLDYQYLIHSIVLLSSNVC